MERTREFLDVIYALWDSWEPGALVFDKANATFTDHAKVHRIDHAGAWFTVEGPLNSPRPAQGRPVIVQVDASADGLALAAATADVLVIRPATMAAAAQTSRAVKAAAAAAGRELLVLADLMPILAGEPAGAATGDGLTFAGTPSAMADLMQAWKASGACDGFNLLPARLPDDLEAVVDALVPELRRRGLSPIGAGATLRQRLGLAEPVSRHAGAALGAVHG